jgi:hypothetical protein
MNTTIVMLITAFVALTLLLALFNYRGFPGSIQHVGWKISGIWENGSRTIQVLIHNNGSIVRGHVVWANEDDQLEKGKLVGALVLKEVKLKSFWRWSKGTYIDPVTNQEFPLRLRLRNSKNLSVHFFENTGGEVLIKEEWQLVNPLL